MLTDFFSPRSCCVCGKRITENSLVCMECLLSIPFSRDSLRPEDNDTARMLWGKLHAEKAVAAVHYLPQSKMARLLYLIKYGKRPDVAHLLGRIVAEQLMLHGFFDDIDIVVPLPLHIKREKQRGYNQSLFIAKGVCEVPRLPIAAATVFRVRDTSTQTRLSASERLKNMEGAFRLVCPEMIEGKHVLLIDDIFTTGASVTACGNELLTAPDTKVSVLTVGKSDGK